MVSLDDVLRTRPYKKGENLDEYIDKVARFWHSDTFRISGVSYYEGHLVPASERIALLIRDTYLKKVGKPLLKLHDGPEDTSGVKVYDPFEQRPPFQHNKIWVNDLLSDAGELGIDLSYCLFNLTRIAPYDDYLVNLFDFKSVKKLRQKRLKLLSACGKDIDVSDNTDSTEKIVLNECVEQYKALEGMGELEFKSFYSQKGILAEAFMDDMTQDINVKWFCEKMQRVIAEFNENKMNRVKKNTHLYFSLAEKNLLFEPFDEIYDPFILRASLKQTMVETLAIYRQQTGNENYYFVLQNSLRLNAPKGYILLADEVLDDARNRRFAHLR